VTLLLVALGAAVGAPLRFVVERLLAGAWPWGTFLVNVAGSAVLGVLVGVAGAAGAAGTAAAPGAAVALVGVGFCGALTTFGGYAAQVLDLAVDPAASPRRRAAGSTGYALLSVVVCVAVAAAAWLLVSAA
jgi:CrcB protein